MIETLASEACRSTAKIMNSDFQIVPNNSPMPKTKSEQINLILHGKVHEAIYKIENRSPHPRTDYSSYFSVTYDDLVSHLNSNQNEFDAILPQASSDGLSVIKEANEYVFRWHFRGVPTESINVAKYSEAVQRFLKTWLLPNQGLTKMIPR